MLVTRNFFKKAISIVIVIANSGCTVFHSPVMLESEMNVPDISSGKTFESVQNIPCQPLTLTPGKDNTRVMINDFTARLNQPEGRTPILAYSIPDTAVHHFSIDSYVIHRSMTRHKAELFYPEIAFLDRHHNIIAKVDSSHVLYKKLGFTSGEGVTTSFTIDNREVNSNKTVCMLIYTTDALKRKTTPLINEEKEYAKVRGVVPPPIPDPVARHGDLGQLRITMKSDTAEIFPVSLPVVKAMNVVKPVTLVEPVADVRVVEIRQHYINRIQQAIKSGQISQALDIRSEVKNLSNKVETYFINNYFINNGGESEKKLSHPEVPGSSYADRAILYSTQKMHDLFQSGKSSEALQLLDQVKEIQVDVDRQFDR